MKILIISAIMLPEIGGPASYVPQIIARMPDYQFRVVTFTENPTPLRDTPIFSIPQNGGPLARQTRLLKMILSHAGWADVIYAQDPVVVGLAAVLAGRILGKRTVIKYVGDPAWEKAFGQGKTTKFLPGFLDKPDSGLPDKGLILLCKMAFLLANRVIVPSKFLEDVIIQKYRLPPSKVGVIYNSVDLSGKYTPNCPVRSQYTVIYAGRLVRWKKVDEIIRAVRIINTRGKVKVKFRIIGDGPEKENLEKLGQKPEVEFLGRRSPPETLSLVKKADVSVLNSLYEGLPHTVIEAFALGVPVVASAIPGTTEAAVNNKTALTVAPGDSKELAGAIERLLLDRRLAKNLTENAFDLIKKKFNWETNLRLLRTNLCP